MGCSQQHVRLAVIACHTVPCIVLCDVIAFRRRLRLHSNIPVIAGATK